jgi:hypothetical protein
MKKKTTSGIVTTNEDPAKVGRVKVTLAEVDGQEYPEWIEPVFVPGWFSPPEAGDEVEVEIPADTADLIEFAHEVKYKGQVFSEGHGPPDELKQTQKKVHLRGFFTKEGHRLIFDDKDKVISLYTPAKMQLLLDEKQDKVSLRYKDTDVITINASGIFFGTESASEPMVLGNLWKTMMDTLFQSYSTHIHPTGVGPSGPPSDAAAWLAEKAKTAATISDFIKGQKTKP